MADDLELLLRSTEGEAPSSEFVASLRERVVAEAQSRPTVGSIESEGDPQVESVVRRPRWFLLAAAAAVVALIAGAVLLQLVDDGVEQVETVDEPDENSSLSTTTVTTTVIEPNQPATFIADAELLTLHNTKLPPGTYRVDAFGVPFSFTNDRLRPMRRNVTSHFIVADPSSSCCGDRDIFFMRISDFSHPSRPGDPFLLGDAWPKDDFEGWLDNVSDEVVVTNRRETTLGGLQALSADLAVNESIFGETDCWNQSESCVTVATDRLVVNVDIYFGQTKRMWVIDQGEDDPIAVVASVERRNDTDWLDTAEAFLATLAFEQ